MQDVEEQSETDVGLSNRLTSLLASPSMLPLKKANINVFQLQQFTLYKLLQQADISVTFSYSRVAFQS